MNILFVLQRYPGFGGIESVTRMLAGEFIGRFGTQTQTLRNRTPVETGADAKGYMEYTLHTLRVTGATGATTFTIATSLDGTGAVTGSNSCRMWFDDLRIERE